VSFAARIALAITGAVAVALVVVAVAGGTQVRRSYLGALRGSLRWPRRALRPRRGRSRT
jgi:hypothetical protein